MEQRYKKDMKNARQAFLVLQKEKRDKWEQAKLLAIKEEATVRL